MPPPSGATEKVMNVKTILMVISAAVILLLGLVHLLYTFWGPKLLPADPQLVDAMKAVPLVITRETTVWKAWLGFNASHSMAGILFGLVYGYLALAQPAVLDGSLFLQGVGLLTLAGLLLLCWNFWFSVPLAGISISLACYAASLLIPRG
jgi:hypothetical protein